MSALPQCFLPGQQRLLASLLNCRDEACSGIGFGGAGPSWSSYSGACSSAPGHVVLSSPSSCVLLRLPLLYFEPENHKSIDVGVSERQSTRMDECIWNRQSQPVQTTLATVDALFYLIQ
ncbi:uncharacterized protein [Aegilops tauschii subsp. strangulata]|uniref:uncharacterized protein isoform X2 n=1 Tax=Aegilops tauschii subsp. strangulata TaxID=200361 RepID=UPI001E1CAE20|nr:uncharacterized protein LOC109739360 isoform X2 [Aegilops tauschii subsp. strangulata]